MKLLIGLGIGFVIGVIFGTLVAGVAMLEHIENQFNGKDGRYGKHLDR